MASRMEWEESTTAMQVRPTGRRLGLEHSHMNALPDRSLNLAGAGGFIERLVHIPPGMIVDVELENGIQRARVHVDSRGAGIAHVGGEQSAGESGLREIWAGTPFQQSSAMRGLDFGKQFMLRYYNLHRTVYREHGIMTYAQSRRGKLVQKVYSGVITMRIGSSVSKCVILLFNKEEDVALAERHWPVSLLMGDFRNALLDKMTGYEFCRAKIPKGPCTFYLYFVKKEGSDVLPDRSQSWANVLSSIGSMENAVDWVQVVSAAVGQMTSVAVGNL